NPALESPFMWETKDAVGSYQEFIRSENRYKQLLKAAPAEAEELFARAEEDAARRMAFYKKIGEVMN
ncbi:MAG: pyruvate-flavodoxin oxidoreductase, partial [Lentisphaeria bacterium]|nr:pyruvate-flavodoxin oxidoreductase [Lentisphaeria bacterium]